MYHIFLFSLPIILSKMFCLCLISCQNKDRGRPCTAFFSSIIFFLGSLSEFSHPKGACRGSSCPAICRGLWMRLLTKNHRWWESAILLPTIDNIISSSKCITARCCFLPLPLFENTPSFLLTIGFLNLLANIVHCSNKVFTRN